MGTRITVNLGNPELLKLLEIESQETNCTVSEVLIRALESYFAIRLETKTLMRTAQSVFEEWNNSKDSEYDKL